MSEKFKDFSTTIDILNGILKKADDFAQHMDIQIQILVGLSSAIFVFSASQFYKASGGISLFLLVLAVSSAISAFVGLFAVHPPGFMRKQGQKESLMYNKRIVSFPSAQKYNKEILKLLKSKEAIIEEYTTEIYNLYKYYYRPKRRLFHLTRGIFIFGFIVSFLFLIAELSGF